MSKQLTRKELIEKIVKEQGVSAHSLNRLNTVSLLKMDAAIPDKDEDLLGSPDSESPSGEIQTTDAGTASDSSQSESDGSPTEGTSQESGSVGSEGDQLGTVVSPEIGTDIVTPPESPSEESTIPTKTTEELSTSPNTNSGSGSRVVIGFHPMTEQPVYLDEQ